MKRLRTILHFSCTRKPLRQGQTPVLREQPPGTNICRAPWPAGSSERATLRLVSAYLDISNCLLHEFQGNCPTPTLCDHFRTTISASEASHSRSTSPR